MQIEPMVEQLTRRLFGHALRAEHDDFQRRLADADGETVSQAIRLAATIAAYVAIDACGGARPTEEELRTIASNLAEADEHYSLTADEVHAYLTKGVFGGQAVHELLAPEDAVRLPFIIGVYLVSDYHDDDQAWWDYLDTIEAAIEAAPDPA